MLYREQRGLIWYLSVIFKILDLWRNNLSRRTERLRRLELDLPTEGLFIATNSGLDISSYSLSNWMADKFNHNFDEYDSAVDSIYNSTHVGGSQYHHLIDGQHSILGAFEAIKGVHTDDSFLKEMLESGEHLLRDTASVSGINPFFGLTPQQFESLSETVKHIGISKPFLADALTINGPELLGGTIAIAATLMMGNKPDPSRLSILSGAYITSALSSANPLLLPVAAGGLVYSIYKSDSKRATTINAGKGALVSGSALLVGGLVGGPVWLGCLTSMCTALSIRFLINNPEKAFNKVQELINPAQNLMRKVSLQIR